MILQIQQQTPEWLIARCGNITGSCVKRVMDRLKNGAPGADRKKYFSEVLSERMTGLTTEHYVTSYMAWGAEQEQYARAAYEVETGNEVDKVGMALHPRIERFSASPDGSVGDNGLVEFKCPTTAKHLEWILYGEVPDEHKDQCYAEMACWERDWVDFVSYDPRVPERHQLFVKRLHRDEKRIAEIEFAVVEFDQEVQDMIARLDGLNPLKAKLRKSVEQIDAEAMITDSDIAWAKEQQGTA